MCGLSEELREAREVAQRWWGQDIAVLNIIALNSLGTLKTQILQNFGKEYPPISPG